MEHRAGHHRPMQAGAHCRVCAVFKKQRQGHQVDADGLNLLRQDSTRVLHRVRVHD
jgi:hypothetical protein